MGDTAPQTADGKVLFHFAMSLDGFRLHRVGGSDPRSAVNVRYRPASE
jgi:hypothetical protein